MPTVTPKPNGTYQIRIVNKLLAKPFYATFATEVDARTKGALWEHMLASGQIPPEMVSGAPESVRPKHIGLYTEMLQDYLLNGGASKSDWEMEKHYGKEVVGLRFEQLTYTWVLNYIRKLKVERNLSPNAISHRIGLHARCIDYHIRKAEMEGRQPMSNPFRGLPRRYAHYSQADAQLMQAKGGEIKRNNKRNRRLTPDEEARLIKALEGEREVVEGVVRMRHLKGDSTFKTFILLTLDTGVRRFEAYRCLKGDFDLDKGIMNVRGSKGVAGEIKWRQVPLRPRTVEMMRPFVEGDKGALVFPYWDGTERGRVKAAQLLAPRCAKLFEHAGIEDFHYHDLRHEATCRYIMERTKSGNWMFTETEVCKIMGWTSTKMLERYLSLRGEDLVRWGT